MKYSIAMAVGVCFLSIICALTTASGQDGKTASCEQLKMLVAVHRHGDRAPLGTYPTDPYANESYYWPKGWGQLTARGKQRAHALGEYIRTTYGCFLTYNPREVYVRSSAEQRCLDTVKLLLAGAYSPDEPSGGPRQPFYIHTRPSQVDGMLGPDPSCPAEEEELEQVAHSPEVVAFTRDFEQLFAYLTLDTGENVTTIVEASSIYDTLFIENDNGLVLPSWATDDVMMDLKNISNYGFYSNYSTVAIQRLRAGLFLKDLRKRILHAIDKTVIQGDDEADSSESNNIRKLFIYSTHDNVIAAILSALGIFNRIDPPYAAAIFFELHQTDLTEHTLKILYLNDTYSGAPFALPVPGCDHLETECHVTKFLAAIEHVIPSNWHPTIPESICFFFSLYFLATASGQDVTASRDELKLLVVAHRHGDRTPIQCYPKDPWGNDTHWPDGFGELTTRGKLRAYALGEYIRKTYGSFLTYNPREVYVRSSAAERCLASTSLLLAGAYPPKDHWVWSDQLHWQPFPIQTEPRKVDGMLVPSSTCPAAEDELRKIRHSPAVMAFTKAFEQLFAHLSLNTGANVTDIMQAENVYDTLFIERDNGLALPSWATDEVMKDLKNITDYTFYCDYSTKKMQRLRAGLFLKDLRKRFLYATDKTLLEADDEADSLEFSAMKKLFIYSTHDSMIALILNALGIFNMIAPPYAASIFFELHQTNETEHTVKILYLNDTSAGVPFALPVPGCDKLETECHVTKFLAAIEHLIPSDWRHECNLSTEGRLRPDVSIFALGSLMSLLLVGFLLLLCIYFKRLFICMESSDSKEDVDSCEDDDEDLDVAKITFPTNGAFTCQLKSAV
ncbi:Lysosomal acid phosphatase [Halotydeus destructor]|nr:Lysosomal acid phosphatase [Halotydeus destructor]